MAAVAATPMAKYETSAKHALTQEIEFKKFIFVHTRTIIHSRTNTHSHTPQICIDGKHRRWWNKTASRDTAQNNKRLICDSVAAGIEWEHVVFRELHLLYNIYVYTNTTNETRENVEHTAVAATNTTTIAAEA